MLTFIPYIIATLALAAFALYALGQYAQAVYLAMVVRTYGR